MLLGKGTKNIFWAVSGLVTLIIGMTCLLLWWEAVVVVFKGVVGGLLGLVGLLLLMNIKPKDAPPR